MKLGTLLQGYPYRGGPEGLDREIKGITHDSRFVRQGDVYICLRGLRVDGHLFASQAVQKGAVAVIAERPLALDVPVYVVEDGRNALSYCSARYFAHPSRKMRVIGVTGTNGKTTTTHFLQAVLRKAGRNCASIGTVGIKVSDGYASTTLTTPEAFDLHRTFFELARAAVTDVVMEVSSHSLSWQRVEHVEFNAGLFLNLSHDHLDFHKNMEDYFAAKAHLFELLSGDNPYAVVNADDEYGRRLVDKMRVPALTFGLQNAADVRGRIVDKSISGSEVMVSWGGKEYRMRVPLPGVFNVYNALAAAAAALKEGIEPELVFSALEGAKHVPGRLEAVNFAQEFNIFIDFAHTPEGLENVLKTLKEAPHQRLITVFGCPGDRDRAKRPIMGQIAEKYSDLVIVTSDNPASEDPEEIIAEILAGMSKRPVVIPDREEAVRYALSQARKGDIVLLAGKGHENYQIMGDKYVPYSDRKAVETFFIS